MLLEIPLLSRHIISESETLGKLTISSTIISGKLVPGALSPGLLVPGKARSVVLKGKTLSEDVLTTLESTDDSTGWVPILGSTEGVTVAEEEKHLVHWDAW